MTPAVFINKWRGVTLKERSFYVSHFNDLCALVGHPTPVASDKTGASFTFERGAAKRKGGNGWADVWKKDFFAFEYKGKDRDLEAAFAQLEQYREDLENPPLLVAADAARLIIKTNFNKTVTKRHVIDLDDLAVPEHFERLRQLFHDPEKLKPQETTDQATKAVANLVGIIADNIRSRGYPDTVIARFMDRVVFCMFAEDVGLLPAEIFTTLLGKHLQDATGFDAKLHALFRAMANGGDFGEHTIPHFNGNLFDDTPFVPLVVEDIRQMRDASRKEWGDIDPSIFGTLFERALDKRKRAQMGQHYTGREDIETLVEPVIMTPLRREWAAALAQFNDDDTNSGPIDAFLARLRAVTILDPACGSGNFLYVSLQKLLDLELEAINRLIDAGHAARKPGVGPWQLRGIEKDPIAFQLAQMSAWIGYLQWLRRHGFDHLHEPILRALTGFENKDAILECDAQGKPLDPPREPSWPEAEFIVGNPPFLGNKRMRSEFGEDYCAALWKLYDNRLPGVSDLCCYWFEKARALIERRLTVSVGLLATNVIKQVENRRVLERIGEVGRIFFGVTDHKWFDSGVAIRIAMLGFDGGQVPRSLRLDGIEVSRINPDMTTGCDMAGKRRLFSNVAHCFMGITKVGDFDVEYEQALRFLSDPNPNGLPNSDILRPLRNGSDLVRRSSDRWIIDFGVNASLELAAGYAQPFEHAKKFVYPKRQVNGRQAYREKWWIHAEARPGLRRALAGMPRYLATARVAKHRLFVWLDTSVLPDSKVIAIAFDEDKSLGLLQSRIHHIWTNANCGWHGGERGTYNPSSCFETFPFPEPTEPQWVAIGEAAKRLNELRENWLNPPEWVKTQVMEFPASADGPWARFVVEPDARGIGTARWPRLVPKNVDAVAMLKKRTLTNLYNERPTWLDLAHRALDEAVFAAYGWPTSMTDDAILAALLALNLARPAIGATSGPEDEPVSEANDE